MGQIDEYQLLVHPIFLGDGKPLFKGAESQVGLRLTRAQTFSNGVSVLCYEPRATGPAGHGGGQP